MAPHRPRLAKDGSTFARLVERNLEQLEEARAADGAAAARPPTAGDRVDNLLDGMLFFQTVFFSLQLATAWRVATKLIVHSTTTKEAAATMGAAVGGVLWAVELAFLVWYYLAIRQRPRVLRVTGLSEQRLMRRVDYLTERWADHAPYWQLVVWGRQIVLTIVVNLPSITNNIFALSDKGVDLNRPVIWCIASPSSSSSWRGGGTARRNRTSSSSRTCSTRGCTSTCRRAHGDPVCVRRPQPGAIGHGALGDRLAHVHTVGAVVAAAWLTNAWRRGQLKAEVL